MIVGSFLSLLFFLKLKKRASFIILAITFGLFHLHLSYSLLPKFNPQMSIRTFSKEILKRMEPGEELKTMVVTPDGLVYYTRKPYVEETMSTKRFSEFIHSPQRVFVVIPSKRFDHLKRELEIEFEPIEQARVGSRDLLLISNQ